jgi:Type VI secretion system VasI, EvfG, VC_A0118
VESATVCEYCGHQTAEPISPVPGVDLDALFDFTPDDSSPQASTPAQPVDEPAAAVDSRDDTDTVPVFDLTDEDYSDPVNESLPPDIEHRSDASAEEATRWFDSLTDDSEPAYASEVPSEPADASEVSSEPADASEVSSEAAYASEVSDELEADEPPPGTIPEPAVIAAAQGVPTPVMRSGVGRTGVMVGLGVAIFSGIVVMALMSTRGVAAPAAGAAPAPHPAKPARPAPSQPAQTSPATAVASAPQWSRNNAEWVGRQRNSAAFELASINKVAVWMRHVQPMLVVRCSAQKPEVFVFTASAAKMEPQDENHTVRVQFDSDAMSTERWPDSSEHDALFAPDGQAFLQRLLTARRLQFGFSPHNADPVVATFQVAGLAEHLASAARQCGWKNR